MNDRNATSALSEGPSFLLQELGIETVYLYRPRQDFEWQFLDCSSVDDEVWKNHEALLFRITKDGYPAIIRLRNKDGYPRCRCTLMSLRPDYTQAGRRFEIRLHGGFQERVFVPARILTRLSLEPLTRRDLVLPL